MMHNLDQLTSTVSHSTNWSYLQETMHNLRITRSCTRDIQPYGRWACVLSQTYLVPQSVRALCSTLSWTSLHGSVTSAQHTDFVLAGRPSHQAPGGGGGNSMPSKQK